MASLPAVGKEKKEEKKEEKREGETRRHPRVRQHCWQGHTGDEQMSFFIFLKKNWNRAGTKYLDHPAQRPAWLDGLCTQPDHPVPRPNLYQQLRNSSLNRSECRKNRMKKRYWGGGLDIVEIGYFYRHVCISLDFYVHVAVSFWWWREREKKWIYCWTHSNTCTVAVCQLFKLGEWDDKRGIYPAGRKMDEESNGSWRSIFSWVMHLKDSVDIGCLIDGHGIYIYRFAIIQK